MDGQDPRAVPLVARRLTVFIVGVAVFTSAVITALVLLLSGTASDVDELRLSQLGLLELHELNESLRGDLLATGTRAVPDEIVDADLTRLRELLHESEVVGLSELPGTLRPQMTAILVGEQEFVDAVAGVLSSTGELRTRYTGRAMELLGPINRRINVADSALDEVVAAEHDRSRSLQLTMMAGMYVFAGVGTAVLIVGVRRNLLGGLRAAMAEVTSSFAVQEKLAQVRRALDQTATDEAVFGVVTRACTDITPDNPSCLLMADPSNANLEAVPTAGESSSGCDVTDPGQCPAMRSGRQARFPSSGALDACPHLRSGSGDQVSALCSPVTFLGGSLGVVQVVGEEGGPCPELTANLLGEVAVLAGARLGTMRALALAQRQATLDPLTGLLNRRTLEDRVRLMAATERPFAVAMLDLDRFKALNDTYGHDQGDRALKLFSGLLRQKLRPDDIASRYGGEEFLLVFPDLDAEAALAALMQLRAELAVAVSRTGVGFTFSGGVTDSGASNDWETLVRIADAALLGCKRAGRDRIQIGDPGHLERREPPAAAS